MSTKRIMLAAAAAATLGACSLITPLDDLRGSGGDAGDDVAADVGLDAADAADGSASVEMKCAMDGVPHLIVNDPDFGDRMAVHASASGLRVAVRGSASRAPFFYDVDGGLTSFMAVTTTVAPANAQWGSFVGFEGGFLTSLVDTTSGSKLMASFLPDAAKTDTGFITIDTTPALPSTLADFVVVAAPIDLASQTFFVAVSYLDGDYPVHAGTVSFTDPGSNVPLPIIYRLPNPPTFEGGSIMLDRAGKRAEILSAPQQGVGDTVALATDLAGSDAGERTLSLEGGAHIAAPFAAPLPGGKNALGYLSGDVQNTNIPLGMRASLVDDTNVTTFDPDSFPALVPLTLQELAVDKAAVLWQSFGQEAHLVAAARVISTGAGVNLVWLDGEGRLRGRLSGATALVPTENVRSAAAALGSAPLALVANLVVGWVTEANDLRMARVGCTAP